MVGALEKQKWIMSEGHFGDDIGKFPKEELGTFLIFSSVTQLCQ